MTALLELERVDAEYGATAVLRGVSLAVPDGGMVALLGANGAGKTTLLRAICNMRVNTPSVTTSMRVRRLTRVSSRMR